MDRDNLRQISGSLFWLLLIFAAAGHTWAVWPMTVAGLVWLALWLTLPGALKGILIGLIASLLD